MTRTQKQRDAIAQEAVYERVKQVVDDDLPPEEAYTAMLAAWDAAGAAEDAEDDRR